MDEFKLINKYFHPLTNNSIESQKLEDDVAILSDNIVVSKDLLAQDVHFRISDGAYNIANRLIRSNLSDIASSGSTPLHYMLGFCKNKHTDDQFLTQFSKALKEINQEFNIHLLGGDTIKSTDKLFFSITIFGKTNGSILSRNNARPGDLIFVSGNIGDAFLGRMILEDKIQTTKNNSDYLISRYYKPNPRIQLGQELIKHNLSKCAIDISDGLFSDIKHICRASNLKSTILHNKIPLSRQAKDILQKNKNISHMDLFSAGDDYELIFTTAKDNENKIYDLSEELQIPLTKIGSLESSQKNNQPITLIQDNKEIKIDKFGYEH
jgi:thiamine-monophosphate kinase